MQQLIDAQEQRPASDPSWSSRVCHRWRTLTRRIWRLGDELRLSSVGTVLGIVCRWPIVSPLPETYRQRIPSPAGTLRVFVNESTNPPTRALLMSQRGVCVLPVNRLSYRRVWETRIVNNWMLRWWRLSSTLRILIRETVRARKSILLGVLCLVGSGLTFKSPSTSGTIAGAGLLALGIVQLSLDFFALRRLHEERVLRPRALGRVVENGPTPSLSSRGYTIEEHGFLSLLRNKRVDALLSAGADAPITSDAAMWAPAPSESDAEIRLLLISDKFRRRQVIFDAEKVRLRADLVIGTDGTLQALEVQRSRYTSTLWTNDIADRQLLHAGRVVFDGLEAFTQTGFICSLESSRCANSIGVSTLAIDPLGAIYIVQQGARNSQGPGRLVASGSGSADWEDLVRTGDSLIRFVVSVGERELREELGTTKDMALSTRVVGFGRWISRGAKPEFFCLTQLERPLPRGRLTPDERLFTHVDGAEIIPLPLDRARAAEAISILVKDRQEILSLPLYWCLQRLRELLLSDNPGPLLDRIYPL